MKGIKYICLPSAGKQFCHFIKEGEEYALGSNEKRSGEGAPSLSF